MELELKVSFEEFADAAIAFFKRQPKTAGGFPTIPLFLYYDPVGHNYCWSHLLPTNELDKLKEHVEYHSSTKALVPIGYCSIAFEEREGRVYLSTNLPHWVNTFFDAEEVLNGTVPCFMHEKFHYEIDELRISDRSKLSGTGLN